MCVGDKNKKQRSGHPSSIRARLPAHSLNGVWPLLAPEFFGHHVHPLRKATSRGINPLSVDNLLFLRRIGHDDCPRPVRSLVSPRSGTTCSVPAAASSGCARRLRCLSRHLLTYAPPSTSASPRHYPLSQSNHFWGLIVGILVSRELHGRGSSIDLEVIGVLPHECSESPPSLFPSAPPEQFSMERKLSIRESTATKRRRPIFRLSPQWRSQLLGEAQPSRGRAPTGSWFIAATRVFVISLRPPWRASSHVAALGTLCAPNLGPLSSSYYCAASLWRNNPLQLKFFSRPLKTPSLPYSGRDHQERTPPARRPRRSASKIATDTFNPRSPLSPRAALQSRISLRQVLLGVQVATAMTACQHWGLRTRYGRPSRGRTTPPHSIAPSSTRGASTPISSPPPGLPHPASLHPPSTTPANALFSGNATTASSLRPEELQQTGIVNARALHSTATRPPRKPRPPPGPRRQTSRMRRFRRTL